MDEMEESETCEHIEIVPGDRILLATDGVTEARNPQGDYFGCERFKRSIAAGRGNGYVLDRIIQDLNRFCSKAAQDDDITLAEIPLLPELLPDWDAQWRIASLLGAATVGSQENAASSNIEFQITLRGSQLRQANPIPHLINYLQDMTDLHAHRQSLFTILTELYVNALDHGVLGLDSTIKEGHDGVSRYFERREHLLRSLSAGYVRMSMSVHRTQRGGHIVIEVEDSGEGFSMDDIQREQTATRTYSGRGITLVENLCESLHYFTPGNRVEAVYRWFDRE